MNFLIIFQLLKMGNCRLYLAVQRLMELYVHISTLPTSFECISVLSLGRPFAIHFFATPTLHFYLCSIYELNISVRCSGDNL